MRNKPQLILIPHAGGSCYSFSAIEPFLGDFNIVPLELPGRGKRIREKLITDFEMAAYDLYRQILDRLNGAEFLVYGHSLGSYLALRITNMLEKNNLSPLYLLVSGNPGPGMRTDKRRYLLEQEDFIKEIRQLGGIEDEFFENKELLEFYLPILRADFELAEVNDMAAAHPVNIPIYAMMGNQEDEVGNIENWSRFTRSFFDYKILEGDHFFINKVPRQTASVIISCYDRVTF